MELGVFLDIAIGLIFVYILLSLLASATNEFIATLFAWRAENLREGIQSLLHDPAGQELAQKVYEHPLIAGLARHTRRKSRNPSYIPARLFATALLDIIADEDFTETNVRRSIEKIPNASIRRALQALLDEAGQDVDKFRRAIESWFNDTMDRVSGWYKRKAQLSLLCISIVLTVIVYANTISISEVLYRDRTLRAAIVATALEAQEDAQAPVPADIAERTEQSLAEIQERIDELLPLPIGWRGLPSGFKGWVLTVTGLGLTAVAVSLGAPFWFDVLSRVSNLRSAGRKPQRGRKDTEEED